MMCLCVLERITSFVGRAGSLRCALDYEEKEYFADSLGNEASLLHQPRVTWRKIMFRWGRGFIKFVAGDG